ncbi:MAG: tRNA lysidine(34) synthetase TilS [Candidatus Zixiibacteriota bacterium]|nr:MAG: tRNA lysidine(34) synthetase TilS [candidate division Zixibacteria bacterium]
MFDKGGLPCYFAAGEGFTCKGMKRTDFIEKVKGTTRRFGLLTKGDTVLVALSGGPDSVALLHALLAIQSEFGLKLYAAHLNHKLRGAESDQDEEFAKDLASRQKVRFFCKRIDVKKEAKKRKLSIEETARELRYRYMEKLADRIKADRIALGHQADDQAETFLMRLIRGSGSAGLSGIPPKRGKIIRPLIQIRRAEIEEFLKASKIPYRLDSSNYLPDYLRNKIRLSLLPRIEEEFNPKIVETLNRTADIISLQQECIENISEQLLESHCRISKGNITFDLRAFADHGICLQREMVRLCVKKLKGDLKQLTFEPVDRALDLARQEKSGKRAQLVDTIWAEVSGSEFAVYRREKRRRGHPLKLPGEVSLREWGIKIKAEILKAEPAAENLVSRNQNVALLDWEKLKEPFWLRSRKRGDKFRPLGMKGTKSVADFLIDAKVPRYLRDEVPVLTSGKEIIWVVGYRISEKHKVTGKTKKVIRLQTAHLDDRS